MSKKTEFKGKSPEELNTLMSELKQELMKEKATVSTGAAAKSKGKIGNLKKNIARILTILNIKKG